MILADKIIYLRKKAGWSQEELAEKMGVSPSVHFQMGGGAVSSGYEPDPEAVRAI